MGVLLAPQAAQSTPSGKVVSYLYKGGLVREGVMHPCKTGKKQGGLDDETGKYRSM